MNKITLKSAGAKINNNNADLLLEAIDLKSKQYKIKVVGVNKNDIIFEAGVNRGGKISYDNGKLMVEIQDSDEVFYEV